MTENFSPFKLKPVARVPSATTTGKYYDVQETPDGTLICSCPGFMYRSECWHVQCVRELRETDQVIDNVGTSESLVEMFEKLFPEKRKP